MGDLHNALVTYGPIAVFLGAAFEGQAAVIAGGFLAHQGLIPLWLTLTAAAVGSALIDHGLFLAGRRFRTARYVIRAAQTPAFAKALQFIERFPISYIFAFRYLFGLRMVSPIAIGVSQVSTLAFTLLNIASAVVWALVFTAVGYWFGETIEATFGRFKGMEHRLTVAVVVLVGVAGLFHLAKWTWSRWQARAG
ncbi:MAG: VTT domain-containing protein [Phenylobacterium sp.]|nr:VTT domain-containing protein [Phenylobacterium sp.]MBP8245286.1 VTT domain-containing protein [Phenylobacterium sp.]